MAATWLDAPASDDLAVDPEVLVSSLPPGDSLRKYIALHPGANGRHVLVAARDFVAGELVLAEVAVIALPLRSDKDGDDLSSLEAECHRVIFTGPFERVPGAALRVLHQIAPASDVYTVERDKVTRRQVLAAALLRASVRCLCQTDNPYAKPAPQRPVATDVPSVQSSSAASASTGPVEPVTRISGYDALFVRSSLLRHSCDPTCAFRSSIEASISAPAIQVSAGCCTTHCPCLIHMRCLVWFALQAGFCTAANSCGRRVDTGTGGCITSARLTRAFALQAIWVILRM
jgi:hypothetical protein